MGTPIQPPGQQPAPFDQPTIGHPGAFGPPGQYSPQGPYVPQGPYGPQGGYQSAWAGPGYPPPRNNGLAIAALVCGVAQFLLWFAVLIPGFISAVLAFIFGLVSMKQIRVRGEAGRGMALAGVILGALGIVGGIVLILLLVVAGVNGSHSVYVHSSVHS